MFFNGFKVAVPNVISESFNFKKEFLKKGLKKIQQKNIIISIESKPLEELDLFAIN